LSSILITGAKGFIGTHLSSELLKRGYSVRGAVRNSIGYDKQASNHDIAVVGDIGPNTNWRNSLDSVDTVIHLASVTHQSAILSDETTFTRVNVLGTEQLMTSCIEAGIKRIIFISSVKVYGEGDFSDITLDESSIVGKGCDGYGRSKLEAERSIKNIAKHSPIEFVIIRVPLVYGGQVRGNFESLLKLLKTGIPLPFLGIKNKRSMISIDNLVDFIRCCISHPKASNNTFLVSDNDDLSLARLVKIIRTDMKIPIRLFYTPKLLLRAFFALLGRSNQFKKLSGNLRVSPIKAEKILGWKPITSVETALAKTVKTYMKNGS